MPRQELPLPQRRKGHSKKRHSQRETGHTHTRTTRAYPRGRGGGGILRRLEIPLLERRGTVRRRTVKEKQVTHTLPRGLPSVVV